MYFANIHEMACCTAGDEESERSIVPLLASIDAAVKRSARLLQLRCPPKRRS
jgi:hypothetical protein